MGLAVYVKINSCVMSVSAGSLSVSVMLLFSHEHTRLIFVLLCLKDNNISSISIFIDKRNGKAMPVSVHERPCGGCK